MLIAGKALYSDLCQSVIRIAKRKGLKIFLSLFQMPKDRSQSSFLILPLRRFNPYTRRDEKGDVEARSIERYMNQIFERSPFILAVFGVRSR